MIEVSFSYIGWGCMVFIHSFVIFMIIKSWNKNDDNTYLGEPTRKGVIIWSLILLSVVWFTASLILGWIVVIK